MKHLKHIIVLLIILITSQSWAGDFIPKNFLQLRDVPHSYSGTGTYCLKVNAGATAVEFVSCETGSHAGLWPTPTYSSVVALWTTCTGYLKSDGTCDTGGSVPATTCTNQLIRSIAAGGAGTCASVGIADITNTDNSGDCTSDYVCLGGHTHSTYAPLADPVFTGSAQIPNGASPTVDAAGEVAVDTTDDQFIYYGGAKRVITYKHRKCFTLELPTTADDGIPVFSLDDAITVTKMRCWTVGGTSAEIVLSDGTNVLDTMTCDADGADDDGNIANATFTANEQMVFNTGTVTGTVAWVNFCFNYEITAE